MSEGFQVSKVTISAKILKWQLVSHLISKGRYRAARAAKKGVWFLYLETPLGWMVKIILENMARNPRAKKIKEEGEECSKMVLSIRDGMFNR